MGINHNNILNQVIDRIRLPSVRRNLNSVADIAGYSPFHFHRLFKTYTGETLQTFSARNRLAYAARHLRANREISLLDVALHCGFNSAVDFSRSFRKQFGCAPRELQKGEYISVNNFSRRESRIDFLRSRHSHAFNLELKVQTLGPFDIAYTRVFHAMDATFDVKSSIDRLYSWSVKHALIDFKSPVQMLGLCWDDMDFTPLSKFIYDAGIVIRSDKPILLEPWLNHIHIPAMKYVVMDFEGDLGDEADALGYLWYSWIPQNKCLPVQSPALEIFQNERSLCDWDNMKLKLAVPITNKLI